MTVRGRHGRRKILVLDIDGTVSRIYRQDEYALHQNESAKEAPPIRAGS